jgi:arylsulfatase
VRIGDWKLVRRGRNNAWELYDLKADRTEMNNLAAAQPERVQQMTTFWNTWAIRANVLPGPEGKPKNEATQKKGNKKKDF